MFAKRTLKKMNPKQLSAGLDPASRVSLAYSIDPLLSGWTQRELLCARRAGHVSPLSQHADHWLLQTGSPWAVNQWGCGVAAHWVVPPRPASKHLKAGLPEAVGDDVIMLPPTISGRRT